MEGPGGEAPSGSAAACQSVHDQASNSSLGRQDAAFSLKRLSGFRETRPMTSFFGKVNLNNTWENAQRKPCSQFSRNVVLLFLNLRLMHLRRENLNGKFPSTRNV